MSTEENKELIRRLQEEVWNKGHLEVGDELMSSEGVLHFRGKTFPLSGLAAAAVSWRTAFPDFHLLVEDLIAEGEKVVSRFTVSGTHQGELFDIAPTGKQISVSEMLIARIKDGKVVELWQEYDLLGLLQQLGALSPVEPTR